MVARMLCRGCDDEIFVPVTQLRIERRACHFECPSCGPRVRAITDMEWEALADAFDYPGGSMISEREADEFRKKLRRIHRYLPELYEEE